MPYNNFEAVQEAFAEFGPQIACVITEAIAANMGVVPPAPGFNAELARLCRENGSLLIFDEVMTGFRVSRAGWYGVEAVSEGWAPDLLTFGKVMGGGFRRRRFWWPSGCDESARTTRAGLPKPHFSGNPVAVAAGLTTLQHCDDELYATVDSAAKDVASLCQ